MFLQNELTLIESYIDESHRSNLTVSTKPIDWHLDHSLKVINRVCDMLIESDPKLYVRRFNFLRELIFLFRFIPRGKGKAPKQVLPPEKISADDLYSQVALAREKINKTLDLPATSHFKHPYFGDLNLTQTQQFLKLHTKHHLKICNDIIN